MAMRSDDEFWDDFDQSSYDSAPPWQRLAINFWRWWYREPLLRATPRPRKSSG